MMIEKSLFSDDGYIIRFTNTLSWPLMRRELEELRDEINRILDTPEENFR